MSEPISEKTCKRCGYVWMPRVSAPKECTKCKHRNWDTPHPESATKCLCGCGRFTRGTDAMGRENLYYRGHKPAPPQVLCACGCGEFQLATKNKSGVARFILGHHWQGKYNPRNAAFVLPRFYKNFDQPGQDCWEWTGTILPTGYGQFSIGRQSITAHRASWTLLRSAIPKGLYVLHHCDNRKCVNPDHLFLGTQKDNVQDCIRKGRWVGGVIEKRRQITHCPRGHEYVGANLYVSPRGGRSCRECRKEGNPRPKITRNTQQHA